MKCKKVFSDVAFNETKRAIEEESPEDQLSNSGHVELEYCEDVLGGWKVDKNLQNLLSNCDDRQEKGDNQIFMVKELLLQSSLKFQPLCRMHWPIKIRINGKRQLRERWNLFMQIK